MESEIIMQTFSYWQQIYVYIIIEIFCVIWSLHVYKAKFPKVVIEQHFSNQYLNSKMHFAAPLSGFSFLHVREEESVEQYRYRKLLFLAYYDFYYIV